jgi:hypothetical protein
MTHQLCRADGVQSTALRPLPNQGNNTPHLRREALLQRNHNEGLQQRNHNFVSEKVWEKAPVFRLTQVTSGQLLAADHGTNAVVCAEADCSWLLRPVIGMPDRCYMIANCQFLDCNTS